MSDVNFIGIKVGDLNNSAIPNMLTGSDDRNADEDLILKLKDREMEAGKSYRLNFTAADFSEIFGYQFTVEFDPEILEFEKFENGALALSPQNFGITLLDKGLLTTSWFDLERQHLEENAVLFSLVFNAKTDELLSNAFEINSVRTKAEAYRENGENLGVALHFDQNDGISFSDFELFQNVPNPFHSATIVSFRLPESQKAALKIFDVSGRLLLMKTGLFDKGQNHITINATDMSTPGSYFYQLETPTHTATGKMIKIE